MTGERFCTLPIYQRRNKVLFYRKANFQTKNWEKNSKHRSSAANARININRKKANFTKIISSKMS